MLAPATLPEKYLTWNQAQGAPSGFQRPRRELFRRFYSDEAWQRLRGPFAIQTNSPTRAYEYPWVYDSAGLDSPKKIVEIAGASPGFSSC